jgi:hypothetical protein
VAAGRRSSSEKSSEATRSGEDAPGNEAVPGRQAAPGEAAEAGHLAGAGRRAAALEAVRASAATRARYSLSTARRTKAAVEERQLVAAIEASLASHASWRGTADSDTASPPPPGRRGGVCSALLHPNCSTPHPSTARGANGPCRCRVFGLGTGRAPGTVKWLKPYRITSRIGMADRKSKFKHAASCALTCPPSTGRPWAGERNRTTRQKLMVCGMRSGMRHETSFQYPHDEPYPPE